MFRILSIQQCQSNLDLDVKVIPVLPKTEERKLNERRVDNSEYTKKIRTLANCIAGMYTATHKNSFKFKMNA